MYRFSLKSDLAVRSDAVNSLKNGLTDSHLIMTIACRNAAGDIYRNGIDMVDAKICGFGIKTVKTTLSLYSEDEHKRQNRHTRV